MNFSGFFERALALIIDGIILSCVSIPSYYILSSLFPSSSVTFWIIYLSTGMLFYLLYFALMESSKYQASPGKQMCGIKVVDSNRGRITFLRAFARAFVKYLTGLISFSSLFIICLFTKKKQNIHDFAAGTFVVYDDENKPAASSQKAVGVLIIVLLLLIAAAYFVFKRSTGYLQERIVASTILTATDMDTVELAQRSLEETGITISAPFNFKRDTVRENMLKGNLNNNIADVVFYTGIISIPFTINAQAVIYHTDASAETVMKKAVYDERFSSTEQKFIVKETEISGLKALRATRIDDERADGRPYDIINEIIVVSGGADRAWIISASCLDIKYLPLIERVMSTVQIMTDAGQEQP